MYNRKRTFRGSDLGTTSTIKLEKTYKAVGTITVNGDFGEVVLMLSDREFYELKSMINEVTHRAAETKGR